MPSYEDDVFDRLFALSQKLSGDYTITPEDRRFVLYQIGSENSRNQKAACMIATEMDHETILGVIKQFNTYPKPAQKALYICLSTTDTIDAYSFLFNTLEKTTDVETVDLITRGLGSTTYPILPIILQRLYTDNREYSIRLQDVLKRLGFGKIEVQLAVLPQIPHERIFRTLFGDKKIDEVKYRNRSKNRKN